MRFAVAITACLCHLLAVAQDVRVCLRSSSDDSPVLHAVIMDARSQQSTGEWGCVRLTSGKRYTVLCPGFRETFFTPLSDTTVFLEVLPFEVPQVTITAEQLPDTAWGSKIYHVEDYCFVRDGIALLVYGNEKRWKRAGEGKMKMLDQCALVVSTPTGDRTFQLQHHHYALRAVADTVAFLWNDEEAFALLPQHPQSWELATLPVDTFYTAIQPVRFTTRHGVAFTDYRSDFPEASFFLRLGNLKKDTLLLTVRDEWTMEIMRSEFKYLSGPDKVIAAQMEEDHGIDKEIVAAYMRGFQQSNYWRPLGTRWKPMGEGHGLLDPHHQRFYHWTNGVGEAAVYALQPEAIAERGWKWTGDFEWLDEEHVLLFFQKGSQTAVWQVIPSTGAVKMKTILHMPFAEKIRYHDGKVYYIWRPFESQQKRFLYSERISSP
jgi:hypothetical protein